MYVAFRIFYFKRVERNSKCMKSSVFITFTFAVCYVLLTFTAKQLIGNNIFSRSILKIIYSFNIQLALRKRCKHLPSSES